MPDSDPNAMPDEAPSHQVADDHQAANVGHRGDTDQGNYVVVARRYRPRSFDELVGQQHVGQALRNAIETSRVGHAYLFTGARGVGKTSTARIFAKALNDPSGPTASPDNDTEFAHAVDSGEDVDVIEIDGASNRGIDEIRSLRANIGVRPSRSRYKIYIIDEVHMLTQAAFNALLKTLEEPPEHVKFIFCTTDPEKIPITVLSRCQRFDFAPVEMQKIVERLRFIVDGESAEAEEQALELIARRAAGSMRDSQSLLEQVLSFSNGKLTADQVHTMLGTADDERLHALATALADRDAASAIRQMDAAIDAGVDAGRLAEQLLGYFRDLMAVTVGCDASMLRHASASLHGPLKDLGEKWGLQTVLAVVGLVDQTLVRIRHSVYSRVLLEAALIQICHLPDLQQIADLAAAAGQQASHTNPAGPEKKKGRVAPPAASSRDVREVHPGASSSRGPAGHHLPPAADQTSTSSAELTTPDDPQSGQSQTPVPSATDLTSQPTSPQPTSPQPTSPQPTSPQPTSPQPTSPQPRSAETDGSVAVMDRKQTSPPASSPVSWNQANANKVWREALNQLESMTESFARVVQSIAAEGDQTLRLTFPHDGALAIRRCELPEHRTAINDAVNRAAGRDVHLEFDLAKAPVEKKVEEPTQPKASRAQRMREIESNELVRSCIDLFDAEIVRIEKPR